MDELLKSEFKKLVLELIEVPSDDREEAICERLDQISPDPSYSNYIFWSDDFQNEDGSFDINGLADKVFSYKPICL